MKAVATNKKGLHEFEVLKEYTAGLVLRGCEVKGVRGGKCSFVGAWCPFTSDGLDVVGLHIGIDTIRMGQWEDTDPDRPKRLLLTKMELRHLRTDVSEKGLTIIPTKLFFDDRNRLKVTIALCRGKKIYDKREDIKKRDVERSMRNDF